MPESVSSNFTQEMNAETNKPIWLYEFDGDGSTLYYAEYPENVTFAGQVYSAINIRHTIIKDSLEGGTGGITISIADSSRAIQAYLELPEYDALRGRRIVIKQVWYDHLVNAADCVTADYYIDTISVDSDTNTVAFHTTEKLDGMTVNLPKRKYCRTSCQWSYKKLGCWLTATGGGYTMPVGFTEPVPDTCNRTLSDCTDRGNTARFGAFPGVPTNRVIHYA